MKDRPRIDRSLVGSSIRVSEHADHVRASFRYMTPNMNFVIIMAVGIFGALMWLCFLSDALGSYLAGSEGRWVFDGGYLAGRYLGPIYSLFSLPRDIYAGLLGEWWGWPPNQVWIMTIGAFGSPFTWLAIVKIMDRTDFMPRLLAVLPFPPFTTSKTLQFYPDRVRIGSRSLPYNPSSGVSTFRLDYPDGVKQGRNSRVYYGRQQITYNNGAARTPVALFALANKAEDVQIALSVVSQWWSENFSAFVPQQQQSRSARPDQYLSHE